MKNTFRDFAKNEGVEIHFIKSDVWGMNSSILRNRLLTRDFQVAEWYTKVSHGLILLGLSAPLTIQKVGTLYIASTFPRDHEARTGNGSHFLAFTDFSWSDIKVIYDGQELTRQAKITYVLKKNRSYGKNLRICSPFMNPGYYKNSHSQSYFKNCGSCQKCMRTITGLIVAAIDPVECNFDLNDKVLDHVRRLFTVAVMDFGGEEPEFWRDIQRHIPPAINDNDLYKRYKANKFLVWYRDFDLSTYKFHTNKTLRKLCWTYCLMRYRGISYTISLIMRSLKNRSIAHH